MTTNNFNVSLRSLRRLPGTIKRLLVLTFFFLCTTLFQNLQAEYIFPADAWNSKNLRILLNELSKQGGLKVPAEFEAATEFFSKNQSWKYEQIKKSALKGLETASLLQPLPEYLLPRFSEVLYKAIAKNDIEVNLVAGDYLAGLLTMLAKSQHPLVEFSPGQAAGTKIVIAWNPVIAKASLWILAIESDSLFRHQHAMISAINSSCDINCFFTQKTGFSISEALTSPPFPAPDLWVIGFRDTMNYMIEERESFRQKIAQLKLAFSDEIKAGIIKSLRKEISEKPLLARYFSWSDLLLSAEELIVTNKPASHFGSIEWYMETSNFLKELKRLKCENENPKTIQKIQKILSPQPWQVPVSISKFCFLPDSNLFVRRIEYKKNDGSDGSIVLVENPYGEQAQEIVHGIGKISPTARVLYLGTAGSLDSDYTPGDITGLCNGVLNELTSIHSPVIETREILESLKKQGKKLIDVEGKWFREGLKNFPKLDFRSILLISDAPLTGKPLVGWKESREKMNHQMEKMVDVIFSLAEIESLKTCETDGEAVRNLFRSNRRRQLMGPNSSVLTAAQADKFLASEIQRELLPTWIPPWKTASLPKNQIQNKWQEAIQHSAESGYYAAGAVALNNLMPPVSGEMIYFWRIDDEYLKVGFHIKEPADQGFVSYLRKNFGSNFEYNSLERTTPEGKIIYSMGKELCWLNSRIRIRYVPFHFSGRMNSAFLQDRGMFACSFHEKDIKSVISLLTDISVTHHFYPDATELQNGQIPLSSRNGLKTGNLLPLTHKITRNRFEKDFQKKLALDIADIIRLLKHPRLISAQRRIDEGKVLETTKVRMEDIDDSDIGSGQNHLVYLSFGSGIDYYDAPWQLQNNSLLSPRIILENRYISGRYNEFYPRNSWDTLAKGYNRYSEIIYFQGNRPGYTFMSAERRKKYFADLTRCICHMGLARSDFPFEKLRFWDISGLGNYVNNEIRVAGQADLTGLIIGIAVPKGTGKEYRDALHQNGFDPALIYEATTEGNSGVRLAYLQCLLDRKYHLAASLLRKSTDRPFLRDKIEKVSASLILDALGHHK